jgi:hypothetical protein
MKPKEYLRRHVFVAYDAQNDDKAPFTAISKGRAYKAVNMETQRIVAIVDNQYKYNDLDVKVYTEIINRIYSER